MQRDWHLHVLRPFGHHHDAFCLEAQGALPSCGLFCQELSIRDVHLSVACTLVSCGLGGARWGLFLCFSYCVCILG